MTDLAKGMLKRGDRMDEAVIAYILHEALMVSEFVIRWKDKNAQLGLCTEDDTFNGNERMM